MKAEYKIRIQGIQCVESLSETVAKTQKTSDLAYVAGATLVDRLEWDKNQIQVLILVTQTSDYLIPSTASLIQKRMAVGQNCLVYDVNLGGSGFPLGLQIAGSLLESFGEGSRGIVLFGDADGVMPLVSAVALEYDVEASIETESQSQVSGFGDILQREKHSPTEWSQHWLEKGLPPQSAEKTQSFFQGDNREMVVMVTNLPEGAMRFETDSPKIVGNLGKTFDINNSGVIPYEIALCYEKGTREFGVCAIGAGISVGMARFSLSDQVYVNILQSQELYEDLQF